MGEIYKAVGLNGISEANKNVYIQTQHDLVYQYTVV